MIPYGKHNISQDDIAAIVEVLKSEYLTQGPIVKNFEDALTQKTGSKYCLAYSNATAALHCACLALGVTGGDVVWTSAISFVASANCALYCGAEIDFIDIDPSTYNISIAALQAKLHSTKLAGGKLPKVLIAVHMCGQSCEMDKIKLLSQEFNFKVIEDASHAVGGKYKNGYIGSALYSDIVVFSFHPVKIITTGEGGATLTNNELLAKRLQLLRAHGITHEMGDVTLEFPLNEIWNYQQISLGFNYRLTDIQAALGLSQLKRIDGFVAKRVEVAERYNQGLSSLPITLPAQHSDTSSSFHLYPIRVCDQNSSVTRTAIYKDLRECGIQVNIHYIPIYLQPFYQLRGFKRGYCPQAESYFRECISLPIYYDLTEFDQEIIIKAIARHYQ
jgi:UDP-4-amino-4,6-dideoxy-N-acetyl-beta-L-altrosamine transaminase